MRFEEKLNALSREDLWQEYCGFLDMSMEEYMAVQRQLMEAQLQVWSASPLGQTLLKGREIRTIDELRAALPLTTYADYANVLLPKRVDMLPGEPMVWIQTTWEGGLRPIKLAPYTRAMMDVYRKNLVATMMMASTDQKGEFDVKPGDRILYGGAPLPYMTGLIPSLFDEDIRYTWLPDANTDPSVSFSQRIKQGFSMGLADGVDYFFGIGSVANYITESFGKMAGGGKKKGKKNIAPAIALRYLKAKRACRAQDRALMPGDLFQLKALFISGTDAHCYTSRLAHAWGVQPIELAAGTESTYLGTENWQHDGMVFFPDACFYEFIPEAEMRRNMEDPSYQPATCLMDEIRAGEIYELVLSVFHGGAFMRYRIGDMYRCLTAGNGRLPHLTFVDRVPDVIDIAGFTRITASSMEEVIRLSRLEVGDWTLKKEFTETDDPFLHMYLEIPPEAEQVRDPEVLTAHLALYLQHFDSDYGDLKKLLNMEPLQITVLEHGTIAAWQQRHGRKLARINPVDGDMADLLASR